MLLLMGNMMALPQIILGFAMLQVFSYNAYQIQLMPLWAFALLVMGLGGIILGVFFTLAVRQVWRPRRSNQAQSRGDS
jgi:membrane-bound ClpP family serine protease